MKGLSITTILLAGWYLMVPPFQGATPERATANVKAPLNEWHRWAGYDSAAECNKEALEFYEGYLRAKQLGPKKIDQIAQAAGFTADERKIFGPWVEQAFVHGICVPANDPRLSGK